MKNYRVVLAMVILACTYSTLPVRAQEQTTAAEEWPAYIRALEPLGEQMTRQLGKPDDRQSRQELYRKMYSEIAQAHFALSYQDPDYPDFWPMFNRVFNSGLPNADTTYTGTAIDGNGVYRLSGFRGSVRMAHIQIGNGKFVVYGNGNFGPTLANFDLDKDVKLTKDGYFEVLISAERPNGYQGDWWKLDPRADYMIIRQIAYDWLNEVDGRFAIQRMDKPASRPRVSADEIEKQLQQVSSYVSNWTNFELSWIDKVSHERELGLVNKVGLQDYSELVGMEGQVYITGLFDLAPDEALVLETEVPEQCRYWNFQLFDELNGGLDWINRQTSLNGFSAALDGDGKFRAVISVVDPGVPNWLDTAGYQHGRIYGRWTKCSSYPEPEVIKVKVADIRKYLPADTPVVSEADRTEAIRARQVGAQLRRRW